MRRAGAAHDHGVLHRDLKPSNIVVDGDGHVHIADFGIAAFVPTAAGEIPLAGTPAFMAPGLFQHKPPSIQSDLYALGMVLYEVATGKEPFGGVPADGLQAAANWCRRRCCVPTSSRPWNGPSCSAWKKIRPGGPHRAKRWRPSCRIDSSRRNIVDRCKTCGASIQGRVAGNMLEVAHDPEQRVASLPQEPLPQVVGVGKDFRSRGGNGPPDPIFHFVLELRGPHRRTRGTPCRAVPASAAARARFFLFRQRTLPARLRSPQSPCPYEPP